MAHRVNQVVSTINPSHYPLPTVVFTNLEHKKKGHGYYTVARRLLVDLCVDVHIGQKLADLILGQAIEGLASLGDLVLRLPFLVIDPLAHVERLTVPILDLGFIESLEWCAKGYDK